MFDTGPACSALPYENHEMTDRTDDQKESTSPHY